MGHLVSPYLLARNCIPYLTAYIGTINDCTIVISSAHIISFHHTWNWWKHFSCLGNRQDGHRESSKMKKHKNMFQSKEQNKTPEADVNETDK